MGFSQKKTENHGPIAFEALKRYFLMEFLSLNYRSSVAGKKKDIFEEVDERDRLSSEMFFNISFK